MCLETSKLKSTQSSCLNLNHSQKNLNNIHTFPTVEQDTPVYGILDIY